MRQKDARIRDRIRCLVFVHQQWALHFRDPWALTARSGPVRQSGGACEGACHGGPYMSRMVWMEEGSALQSTKRTLS